VQKHVLNMLILDYNILGELMEIQILQSVFVKTLYNQSKNMELGNVLIEEEVECVTWFIHKINLNISI